VDDDALLDAARAGLAALAPRLAELIASTPDPHLPVPGTDWSVREVAVHLVVAGNIYAEIATGTPSPLEFADAAQLAALNAGLIADYAESDPTKLAVLAHDSLDRVLEVTAGRSGDQPVTFHNGRAFRLAPLVGILVGEVQLHGSDLAAAMRRPWPTDRGHATLVTASAQGLRWASAVCPSCREPIR